MRNNRKHKKDLPLLSADGSISTLAAHPAPLRVLRREGRRIQGGLPGGSGPEQQLKERWDFIGSHGTHLFSHQFIPSLRDIC